MGGAFEGYESYVLTSTSTIFQVYRYLFVYDHPVALIENFIRCPGLCGYIVDTQIIKLPVQVLLTCRQIHDEGRFVMYHDNSWAVQGPAYTPAQETNILMNNEHLFDKMTRHQSTYHIRFLDFSIHLAPIIVRYLSLGEIFSHRGSSDFSWAPPTDFDPDEIILEPVISVRIEEVE